VRSGSGSIARQCQAHGDAPGAGTANNKGGCKNNGTW
jgi:hypothetical protein